jgi:hypothetical protein
MNSDALRQLITESYNAHEAARALAFEPNDQSLRTLKCATTDGSRSEARQRRPSYARTSALARARWRAERSGATMVSGAQRSVCGWERRVQLAETAGQHTKGPDGVWREYPERPKF